MDRVLYAWLRPAALKMLLLPDMIGEPHVGCATAQSRGCRAHTSWVQTCVRISSYRASDHA